MGRKKNKLTYGWGINDVDHPITKSSIVNGVRKTIWICPYYEDWKNMIQRAYDVTIQNRQPTYSGCTVCEEWKYLSNFIKWVDSQPNRNWINCELDKDFLVKGNKCYSPDTCVYIDKILNGFMVDSGKIRGNLMIGVSFNKRKKKPYTAQCCNPLLKGGSAYIGTYSTELEAHLAWKAKKHGYACQLASLQEDPSVVNSLLQMYDENTDLTNK